AAVRWRAEPVLSGPDVPRQLVPESGALEDVVHGRVLSLVLRGPPRPRQPPSRLTPAHPPAKGRASRGTALATKESCSTARGRRMRWNGPVRRGLVMAAVAFSVGG